MSLAYLTMESSGKIVAKQTCPTQRLCLDASGNVFLGTGDNVLAINDLGVVSITDQSGSGLEPYLNFDGIPKTEYPTGTWIDGFVCGPPGFTFDIYFRQDMVVDPSGEGLTLHLELGDSGLNIATGLVGPYTLPTEQGFEPNTTGFKLSGQFPNPVTAPPGESYPYNLTGWPDVYIGNGYSGFWSDNIYFSDTCPLKLHFFNSYGSCYEFVPCWIKGYYETTY